MHQARLKVASFPCKPKEGNEISCSAGSAIKKNNVIDTEIILTFKILTKKTASYIWVEENLATSRANKTSGVCRISGVILAKSSDSSAGSTWHDFLI